MAKVSLPALPSYNVKRYGNISTWGNFPLGEGSKTLNLRGCSHRERFFNVWVKEHFPRYHHCVRKGCNTPSSFYYGLKIHFPLRMRVIKVNVICNGVRAPEIHVKRWSCAPVLVLCPSTKVRGKTGEKFQVLFQAWQFSYLAESPPRLSFFCRATVKRVFLINCTYILMWKILLIYSKKLKHLSHWKIYIEKKIY